MTCIQLLGYVEIHLKKNPLQVGPAWAIYEILCLIFENLVRGSIVLSRETSG